MQSWQPGVYGLPCRFFLAPDLWVLVQGTTRIVTRAKWVTFEEQGGEINLKEDVTFLPPLISKLGRITIPLTLPVASEKEGIPILDPVPSIFWMPPQFSISFIPVSASGLTGISPFDRWESKGLEGPRSLPKAPAFIVAEPGFTIRPMGVLYHEAGTYLGDPLLRDLEARSFTQGYPWTVFPSRDLQGP